MSKPFLDYARNLSEIIANMRIWSALGARLALVSLVGSLYVYGAFAQSSADQINAAMVALRAKEFTKALQLLAPVLRESPGNPKLWTLQALAQSGEGHKKEALTSFQNALKNSPDYLPALEGAAQIEYENGSDAAAPLLQRILKLRPGDQTSHAMLAILSYKHGDCATAVQHFDQAGAQVATQPAALQGQVTCLVKLKRFGEAIAILQKMLESNGSDTQTRYQLASLQIMAERPKDAIETLAPSLQPGSRDTRAMQLASSAYEATGDTPNAVRVLREAIVADPREIELYIDFANLCMDHQSFQVGIDMINSGLQRQPQAAQLYVARGVLYVQLAKFDEAEADFEKANALDPAGSLGSVAQGLEAVQSNDPDRALATIRGKLAKKPNDPYLLYLQADVLTQKGVDPGTPAFDTALRSAKKAVTLQPSLGAARDILAKLYLQSGQNQLAIEQCRKALTTDPKDQTALYHLIQGLRKTSATAEIPDLLKKLAELRAESSKQESEHNRYKLVEEKSPAPQPGQP